MISLGFVVCALIEFAFLILLDRKSSTSDEKEHKDKISRQTEDRKSSGTFSTKVHPFKGLTGEAHLNKEISICGRFVNQFRKNSDRDSNMIYSADEIDFLSFCLFIVLFVLFNVIYWLGYIL